MKDEINLIMLYNASCLFYIIFKVSSLKARVIFALIFKFH